MKELMPLNKDLFIAFFRAGMLGYGGGLSAIPLMKREVVDRYKWMDDDEFADVLALANALPGPVNTKLSGYIGWRLNRWPGMLSSLAATIFPTAVLMVVLLTLLNAFKEKPWVQGMARGVIPIAGVMIGVMAIDFLRKAGTGLGWTVTIVLVIASLALTEFAGVHPAIIIFALILSAFIPRKRKGDAK